MYREIENSDVEEYADESSDVEDEEGWAELGRVGMQLNKRYPDFDPRTYGHKKLSELVAASGSFEKRSQGNAHYIRLIPKKTRSRR